MKAHRQKGISLIELAVAIVILGLFTATSVDLYRTYSKQRVVQQTAAKGLAVQKAMARFYSANGRLPCPADPTLGVADVNSGLESCTPVGNCAINVASGVCTINGARDTDGTGGVDKLLYGTIPYATIGVTIKDSYDGWARKLNYVVSARQTDKTTYNSGGGAVRVVNPVNVTGSDYSTGNTAKAGVGRDEYFLFVFSSGSDGKGSYTPDGVYIPCGVIGRDVENCDMDFAFVIPSGKNGAATVNIRSFTKSGTFFDDYPLFYEVETATGYWTYNTSMSKSIMNSGDGRVGVNQPLPTQRLDIQGNLLSEKIKSTRYCDASGNNCIVPSMFIGAGSTGGLRCGADQGLSGIASSSAVCPNFVGPAIPVKNCPVGKWAIGIDSSGGLLCEP